MARLKHKIALVTGAARGIGAAIAKAFAAEGATVIVTDINEAGAHEVARALGARASARGLDVREELAWAATMAHVLDAHGRLDVLVNNAGITGLDNGARHDPEHASLADWLAVHRTNLDGTFLGCKHALRTMRRAPPAGAGGSIVNISSRSGIVGISGAAAYASSKAAVRNHSKSVALYCAEQGLKVRCNSIHPAAILTPMWEPLLGDGPEREAKMAEFVADTPLRRFGAPEEVAAVAVMLASDESAYITGAEFHIDGGCWRGVRRRRRARGWREGRRWQRGGSEAAAEDDCESCCARFLVDAAPAWAPPDARSAVGMALTGDRRRWLGTGA